MPDKNITIKKQDNNLFKLNVEEAGFGRFIDNLSIVNIRQIKTFCEQILSKDLNDLILLFSED